MNKECFGIIQDIMKHECGIQLVSEKTSMIQSRLRHRLKALGVKTFPEYVNYIKLETSKVERRNMISALTTNVSHFFREIHHFEYLASNIAPIINDRLLSGERVRIWSAGCSNGQEAISIAITLLEKIPNLNNYDIKILATDIDYEVIEFSKNSSYRPQQMSNISENRLNRFFRRIGSDEDDRFRPIDDITSLLNFKELNLFSNWPMKLPYDIIFCRNVVIYFDQNRQNELWKKFRKISKDQCWLFIGHSERIISPERFGFDCVGPTVYQTCPAVG